jgi:hypothetical protein
MGAASPKDRPTEPSPEQILVDVKAYHDGVYDGCNAQLTVRELNAIIALAERALNKERT